MCEIMKMGQIVVLCDLSDTWLTVPAWRPSPSSNEYLNLVSVCSKLCRRNHQDSLSNIWAIMSQNNNIQVISMIVTCAQSATGWTQGGTLAQRAITPVPGNKWDSVRDTQGHASMCRPSASWYFRLHMRCRFLIHPLSRGCVSYLRFIKAY